MTNQRLRTRLIALAALLLLAAGCSGTDDDAIPPLEPTASSEQADTTAEDTTTTSQTTTSTTEASTTTEASVAPELDPDNWDSDLDEIFGRYLLYWQALDEAYAPPEVRIDYEPLAETVSGDFLSDVRIRSTEYTEAGHVLVIAEDALEEHILRLPRPTSLTKDEGNEVIIQDCWIADRTKQTVDGEIVETWSFPTLFNATMKVIDGEWRVFANVTASDESDGWDECNEYYSDLG